MLTEGESQGLEELGGRRVTALSLSLVWHLFQLTSLLTWKEATPVNLHPGPSIPGWLVAKTGPSVRILALGWLILDVSLTFLAQLRTSSEKSSSPDWLMGMFGAFSCLLTDVGGSSPLWVALFLGSGPGSRETRSGGKPGQTSERHSPAVLLFVYFCFLSSFWEFPRWTIICKIISSPSCFWS